MAVSDLDDTRVVTAEQLATIRRTWSLGARPGGELGKAQEVVLSRAGTSTDPGLYRWVEDSEMWEPVDPETTTSRWADDLRYACAKRSIWDERFAALFGRLLHWRARRQEPR